MIAQLELPTGENSLMVAYKAVEEGGTLADSNQIVAAYQQHFTPTAAPVSPDAKVFERISLIDPNIRTVVRGSTASL